jgi:hypothetical protein
MTYATLMILVCFGAFTFVHRHPLFLWMFCCGLSTIWINIPIARWSLASSDGEMLVVAAVGWVIGAGIYGAYWLVRKLMGKTVDAARAAPYAAGKLTSDAVTAFKAGRNTER